ncbi:transposase [Bradyrhizobium sp. RT9b]|uniref:transposase n=1 Tax=Bradyrhizobium sp. RT9b TaxID=3156385 RepID=UPI0033950280
MTCRTFPTAFKLAAIKRLKAGKAVLPLARELGVSGKLLYHWRKASDLHGSYGLNRKRGPKTESPQVTPLAEPAAKPQGRTGAGASEHCRTWDVSAKPIPWLQNSNERAKKPPAWREVWDGIGQQNGRPFGRLIGRAGEPGGGP